MTDITTISNRLRNFHADNFVAYFKVHTFHFDIQGKTFSQDHSLLNDIYDFLWEMHDTIGEQIRQLDCVPYPSLKVMLEETLIEEVKNPKATAEAMFAEVEKDIQTLIDGAQSIYIISDPCGGCQTLLGDYIKALSKLHWKVKATIGKSIK